MKEIRTDLLIIGAGPGGLSSAIYAARGGINFEIVEKYMAGGQIINTYMIENYPGFKDEISGLELIQNIVEHCKKFNINIREYFPIDSIKLINSPCGNKKPESLDDLKGFGDFKDLENFGDFRFICFSNDNIILTKSIILATGASPKRLGVPSEEKFIGKGISFCATCDGALYRDREVAVVGGGNSAIEEALFLTRFAKKVYIIHRRDELRAVKILQDRAFSNEKIDFLWSSEIVKFVGKDRLEEIIIKNNKSGKTFIMRIDGVFEYVGITPNSELVKSLVDLDENGFVITNSNMETSHAGVFAVGDVRNTPLRQVVTAVSDGAVASTSAGKFLREGL